MKNAQRKTTKEVFAFCTNVALVLLGILGLILLFTVPIPRYGGKESVATWKTFKFFTTDSNILLAIACLISSIYMLLKWNGKVKGEPHWVFICKMIATATTTLTMIITIFVLTPGCLATKTTFPASSLYHSSNLLYHVINPIFGIVCFLLFENRKDVNIKKTCYTFIPIVIYCIFYVTMAYTHANPDGTIPVEYDWYKFASGGPIATPFIIIGMIGLFYLITWSLWLGNRRIDIKGL